MKTTLDANISYDADETIPGVPMDELTGRSTYALSDATSEPRGPSASEKELLDDMCHYISANPLTAAGIALATGLVIGRMVR
jgi:hypothetical protein